MTKEQKKQASNLQIAGKSPEEIATALGLPLGDVRRALKIPQTPEAAAPPVAEPARAPAADQPPKRIPTGDGGYTTVHGSGIAASVTVPDRRTTSGGSGRGRI